MSSYYNTNSIDDLEHKVINSARIEASNPRQFKNPFEMSEKEYENIMRYEYNMQKDSRKKI